MTEHDIRLIVGELKGQIEALKDIVRKLDEQPCPYVRDIEDLKKFQWRFAGAFATVVVAIQLAIQMWAKR